MSYRVLFLLCLPALVAGQNAPLVSATASRDLSVTVGKSVLVDSGQTIERVAVANADLAEAVAVSPHEVLVNGKAPGETSLIVWQQGGSRIFFDLAVQRNEYRIDAIRREIARELPNQNVTIDTDGNNVFLRGTVKDLTSSQRAVEIASVLGKPVNLLRVQVPKTDEQILLKVKFIDVDRSTASQFGINLFSTGATNTIGTTTTGQFGPPAIVGTPTQGASMITLNQALNLFLFRPDLNLGATIAALESRNLVQILAEPNVLAINGHEASFLAGGMFPYPTLQGGGAGLGAVTIMFQEFGVRITFTPFVTPRGTILLKVNPEVSSLDYANGLVFQGFTIPGISTRRVSTEIELSDGQTFAIGGLLDNRDTETFDKVPWLGDIPFLGQLFRSRQINKSNSELLVMVTPQLVRPIPKGQPLPDLHRPSKFLPPNTSSTPPQTPGVDVTGPVPPATTPAPIPVEDLVNSIQAAGVSSAPAQQQVQFVPVQPMVAAPQTGGQPAGPTAAPAPVQPPSGPNPSPQTK